MLLSINKFCIILFILFSSVWMVWGQNRSRLEVRIIDPNSDAIISGEVIIYDHLGSILAKKSITKADLVFDNLTAGQLNIEIKSSGFQLFKQNIFLKEGLNNFTASLKIINIEAEIKIEQSELDKRLDQAFTAIFTQDEIDALPDNPQEIEEELKRRFGNDLTIRVNGYVGGQIPAKALIRSIQVSRSGFDAEFHELGSPSVNITTKSNLPKFFGSLMMNYGNSKLNARNAFAQEKPEGQNYMFLGLLGRPITKTSSFLFSYNRISSSRETNVITGSDDKTKTLNENSGTTSNVFWALLNFDIGQNTSLKVNYQNSSSNTQNAGVGGLNLLEHGFGIKTESNELKVSSDSTFYKKFINQFRSRLMFSKVEANSNSQSPGIIVSDAFNAGGADIDNASKGKQFEIFEMVSAGYGKQFVKVGGEFNLESRNRNSKDGINGSFFFNSIANFLKRSSSQFVRTNQERTLLFSNTTASAFVQNDLRLLSRLQLGLGLRYEIQNNISDKNNFSPRISATIALDKRAKFVFRLGAGRLYQWYDISSIQQILENNGRLSKQIIIINPGFPNPNVSGLISQVLAPSIYKQASDLVNPYQDIFQAVINGNLGGGIRFDTTFQFQNGVHLLRSRDINAPIGGVRQSSQFGRIIQLESNGNFNRRSFDMNGTGVLFKRIRFSGRYRLSKSTDDFSDIFSLPMNNYNLRLEKGPSNSDQRHFITGGAEFSPFKDIRINPTFIIGSPLPYTVTTGVDGNQDTIFNDRPNGITRNSERGTWTKTINLNFQWAIPIFKKRIGIEKQGNKDTIKFVPDALKYQKVNLSINVNNLFNSNNKSGFIGNQLSPFFGIATRSAPARSILLNLTFIYY